MSAAAAGPNRPQAVRSIPSDHGRPVSPDLTGRIPPVDPADAPPAGRVGVGRPSGQVGGPRAPPRVVAHCPPLVRAAAGLSAALERSGQLPAGLRDLVCLRVAQLIGCPF